MVEIVDLVVVGTVVAIVGVGQGRAVAAAGMKAAFAVQIAVGSGVEVVGRYILVAGMIDCIGEEIFYMDLRAA